jgi:protein-tyrosine-phosphatase
MAEAIARAHFEGGDPSLFIGSAGIAAMEGAPSSPEALNALQHMGIEHNGRSKQLTPDMIRKADLVLCMTPHHVDAVRSLVGGEESHLAKVHLLDPDGQPIVDPFGLDQSVYTHLASLFAEMIPKRVESLLATSA